MTGSLTDNTKSQLRDIHMLYISCNIFLQYGKVKKILLKNHQENKIYLLLNK